MSGSGAARFLLVEDERHLATAVKLNLELEGYEVELAASGRDAAAALLRPGAWDLLILDVMLPDMDGFELCRRLRDSGNFTPVLMLTARDATADRVRGLEAGADDYVTKPFELEELLARVRSLLRRRGWDRTGGREAPASFVLSGVQVDFERYTATVDGEPVPMTKLEIDLLRYFVERPDRVISREELAENVWHVRYVPSQRMVDNFVMRLRKRFERDPTQPVRFLSVRGAGYRFVPES
jgi:DNA-binding response OmpR family regulator